MQEHMTDLKTIRQTLRDLAENASPGQWYTLGQPWCHSDNADLAVLSGSPDPSKASNIVAECDLTHEWIEGEPDGTIEDRANAKYISKANPENILRLLDALEEAEKALEEITGGDLASGEGIYKAECAREALSKLRGGR